LALGIGAGLIKTMKPPPKLADADRWNLPKWAPLQTAPLRQAIMAEPLFALDPVKKKAAADAQAAASVPVWRFTGTVREGSKNVALIEVDKGRKIKKITAGDELPGGAKVTSVQVGTLIYTDSLGEQVLKLFNPGNQQPDAAAKPRTSK